MNYSFYAQQWITIFLHFDVDRNQIEWNLKLKTEIPVLPKLIIIIIIIIIIGQNNNG